MEYKAFEEDDQRELTVKFIRNLLTDDLVVSSLARALTGTVGYDDFTRNLHELQAMGDRLVHMLVGNPSPEVVDKLLVASAPQVMHLVKCAYLAQEKSMDTSTPATITSENLPDHNYILWLACRHLTIELARSITEHFYSHPLTRDSFDRPRNRETNLFEPKSPRFNANTLGYYAKGLSALQATRENTPGFPEMNEEEWTSLNRKGNSQD